MEGGGGGGGGAPWGGIIIFLWKWVKGKVSVFLRSFQQGLVPLKLGWAPLEAKKSLLSLITCSNTF